MIELRTLSLLRITPLGPTPKPPGKAPDTAATNPGLATPNTQYLGELAKADVALRRFVMN
jgi:hypothetical protein